MKNSLLKTLLVLCAVIFGGAQAWAADKITATLEHTAGTQWGSNTGANTVDAEKEHYNSDAASAWAGAAYAEFNFAELPSSGIAITKAVLKYSMNQGGKYGRTETIYYMTKGFTLDYTYIVSDDAKGKDLRYSTNRQTAATQETGGTGDRGAFEVDVTNAVKAIYEEGQKYIIFQWTNNAGGADLYGKGSTDKAPTLVITTQDASTTTSYTVNYLCGENPIEGKAAVVHEGATIGAEVSASAEETASFQTDGKKYIYQSGNTPIKLVAEASSNVINLVFREADVYTIKVNAYDKDDNLLANIVADQSVIEGESFTYPFQQNVLKDNVLYQIASNGTGDWYRNTVTPTESGETKLVYNKSTVNDVVFYTECENIEGVNVANYTNRASFGQVAHTGGAETYVDVTTLAPGKYQLYWKGLNGNSAARTFNVKVGTAFNYVGSISNGTNVTGNSEEFTVSASSVVSLASEGSSASGLDWIYFVKTGDLQPATISAGGYTTFCPINFNVSVPEGVTAYTAEFDKDNMKVKLHEVTDGLLAKGEGYILKGTADETYAMPYTDTEVPVIEDNELVGMTESAPISSGCGIIALAVQKVDGVSSCFFGPWDEDLSNIFPAGKAYIKLTTPLASAAKLEIVIDDEASAIAGVSAKAAKAQGRAYNLAGQTVSDSFRGIVVKDGKKVIK